ncbi:unnamed protein product [Leptosia nina]|uniref:Uncharacterized protein n=1 Tax=Leptosia nina TaxID=320188 RepID=A0AAV1J5L3_9NEOP
MLTKIIVLCALLLAVHCLPIIDYDFVSEDISTKDHIISKRFINPALSIGSFSNDNFLKIRTRRSSEEECEKLALCKLHARSQNNFVAAFELYFVNKENARLWDHEARSISDCYERYSCDE